MARVKKGVTAHARHKKILKLAKGYRGTRSRLFKKANETVMKALYYARRDRRAKTRIPSIVDRSYQRSGSHQRYNLQPFHRWFS